MNTKTKKTGGAVRAAAAKTTRAKLQAVARKAEKAALREYKEWETDWQDADNVFLSVYDAVFCAWREATGRKDPQTDAECEEQDQEFLDDPVADAVMAPYSHKYNR